MPAPSLRPSHRLWFERSKRWQRRLRDVWPVTTLGLLVAAAAAFGLRQYAFARMDLVWLVVAYALIGLLAVDLLAVVVATLVLKLRLRVAPLSARLAQTHTPVSVGFRPPRWTFVPLLRVRHEVITPTSAQLVSAASSRLQGRTSPTPSSSTPSSPISGEEWLRFERRGEHAEIIRRVIVGDVLGFAELAFYMRQEVALEVRPHPGALGAMPVLMSLRAGDELAHPLGAADGDRVELRRYQPGDSARFIHWKIYARTGKLLVRMPERALAQTTRTVAYLMAGPHDEPSAAAARVALETQALGEDWAFGADGTPGMTVALPAALEAIVRSAESEGPSGLQAFVDEVERRGPARLIVFAPVEGPWIDTLSAIAASRPGRVQVVMGVDGLALPTPRTLLRRLLRTEAATEETDLRQLNAVRKRLQALKVESLVVDRRSGRALGEAHFRALAEQSRSSTPRVAA